MALACMNIKDPHSIVALRPKYQSELKQPAHAKRPPTREMYYANGDTEIATMFIHDQLSKAFYENGEEQAYDYFVKLLEETSTRTADGRAFEVIIQDVPTLTVFSNFRAM